eukprot:1159124-Pelagomonas_calceolata.AAC.5
MFRTLLIHATHMSIDGGVAHGCDPQRLPGPAMTLVRKKEGQGVGTAITSIIVFHQAAGISVLSVPLLRKCALCSCCIVPTHSVFPFFPSVTHTADLAARLAGVSAAGTPALARQSQGGAELGSSRWSSWVREAAPKAGEEGYQEGGPLTDPSFAERMGGLPDMGWEKTALRESLGGIDLYSTKAWGPLTCECEGRRKRGEDRMCGCMWVWMRSRVWAAKLGWCCTVYKMGFCIWAAKQGWCCAVMNLLRSGPAVCKRRKWVKLLHSTFMSLNKSMIYTSLDVSSAPCNWFCGAAKA